MNPLIKKTIEKIGQHLDLTEGEKMCIAGEVGTAILLAIESAEKNPNYNLCGDGYIDENTIGNFSIPDFDTSNTEASLIITKKKMLDYCKHNSIELTDSPMGKFCIVHPKEHPFLFEINTDDMSSEELVEMFKNTKGR